MNRRWLDVIHETRYDYAAPVEVAQHLAYLKPLEDHAQTLEQHRLGIWPEPSWRQSGADVFGNRRMFFSLYTPHRELVVIAQSRIDLRARFLEVDLEQSTAWELVRERLRYVSGAPFCAASEYLFASPYVPLHPDLTAYARATFCAGRPIAAAAYELMQRIYRDFDYQAESTDVSTPLLEAFRGRHGVCQDFAHILIACVRGLGLAARYISGYLLTHAPGEGVDYIGADASHAWASVYCPGLGRNGDWLDLDPTNDLIPAAGHITLARGRDYGDVTPLRGVIRGGGEHTLSVAVSVTPIDL